MIERTEQTALAPLTGAEIDAVSGGIFVQALAIAAYAAVMYQIGYARGENEGEKTCPVN